MSMERVRVAPYLAISMGVVGVSFASIFIRLSGAPPLVIAAYRMGIASIILFPIAMCIDGCKELRKLGTEEFFRLTAVGLVLAAHFGFWTTSLSYTSVASSVILVNLSPVFVAVASHLFFQEKINPRMGFGIALAFAGASIITVGDAGLGETGLQGVLYALVGALTFAIYLLSGRRIRQRLSLFSYILPVYGTCAVSLTAGCWVMAIPLYPYAPREYLIFTALAVIPTIFGHTLYNWALKYVEAPITAVSLLGETVGTTLLAITILDEIPSPTTLVGGALALTGIFITAKFRAQHLKN